MPPIGCSPTGLHSLAPRIRPMQRTQDRTLKGDRVVSRFGDGFLTAHRSESNKVLRVERSGVQPWHRYGVSSGKSRIREATPASRNSYYTAAGQPPPSHSQSADKGPHRMPKLHLLNGCMGGFRSQGLRVTGTSNGRFIKRSVNGTVHLAGRSFIDIEVFTILNMFLREIAGVVLVVAEYGMQL